MSGIFSKFSLFSKFPLSRLSRWLAKDSVTSVMQRSRIRSNDFSPSSLYQLDRAYDLSPTKFTVADLLQLKVCLFYL